MADSGTLAPTHNNGPTVARGGGAFERVTVNLTEKSSEALAYAVALTRDSKTDSINKALQAHRHRA